MIYHSFFIYIIIKIIYNFYRNVVIKIKIIVFLLLFLLSGCSIININDLGPNTIDIENGTKYSFSDNLKYNGPLTTNLCPSVGNVKLLTFVVSFDDSDYSNILNDVNLAFNASDTTLGYYSVNSYYLTSSYSKLNLNSDIFGVYKAKHNPSYYEYYKIDIVIADRDCGGLNIAENAGIKAVLLDRKVYKKDLFKKIDEEISNIDLVVLAGFLSIVDSAFIRKWEGKIINIHPSLLPKYGGKGMYGIHVHEAVIANKEKESGCTVHYVTDTIDGGDIIMQTKVEVKEDDTAEILQKRVLVEEHKLLPATVKKLSKM